MTKENLYNKIISDNNFPFIRQGYIAVLISIGWATNHKLSIENRIIMTIMGIWLLIAVFLSLKM